MQKLNTKLSMIIKNITREISKYVEIKANEDTIKKCIDNS